jgi:hypothetical protein
LIHKSVYQLNLEQYSLAVASAVVVPQSFPQYLLIWESLTGLELDEDFLLILAV